ncbi:MAG: hypothetical protein K6G11_00275, partial [Lachnospiraceae bacterium]|nr:hypothetical protein [Lachnospiraceae bacterium]
MRKVVKSLFIPCLIAALSFGAKAADAKNVTFDLSEYTGKEEALEATKTNSKALADTSSTEVSYTVKSGKGKVYYKKKKSKALFVSITRTSGDKLEDISDKAYIKDKKKIYSLNFGDGGVEVDYVCKNRLFRGLPRLASNRALKSENVFAVLTYIIHLNSAITEIERIY